MSLLRWPPLHLQEQPWRPSRKTRWGTQATLLCRLESQCWKFDILHTWHRMPGVCTHKRFIKPQSNKVQVIQKIQLTKQVKQLWHFLGMVQYYRDLWARQSKMLAPLTSLFGECSQTKVTKAKGTKKVPWHWDKVHQRAFDHVKDYYCKRSCLGLSGLFKSLQSVHRCFEQTAWSSNYSG